MIETIDLPELIAIGIPIEAAWKELPVAVPRAWKRLFEFDTGATSFLEVSIEREGDQYREFVGYLAAGKTEVPEGLTRIVIPAQRYLRLVHDGPLDKITEGFEALGPFGQLVGECVEQRRADADGDHPPRQNLRERTRAVPAHGRDAPQAGDHESKIGQRVDRLPPERGSGTLAIEIDLA